MAVNEPSFCSANVPPSVSSRAAEIPALRQVPQGASFARRLFFPAARAVAERGKIDHPHRLVEVQLPRLAVHQPAVIVHAVGHVAALLHFAGQAARRPDGVHGARSMRKQSPAFTGIKLSSSCTLPSCTFARKASLSVSLRNPQ